MMKNKSVFYMWVIRPSLKSFFTSSLKLSLAMMLLLVGSVSNAEMYKYITKEGKTVLTGERLKGTGNRRVKIYQIKKTKAYKSSVKKKAKNSKKYAKKRSKSRKYRRSSRNKALANLVKPNGRDSGIIIGCNSSDHLTKQANIYKNPIKIYSRIYDVDEELIHAIVRQESCFNEGAHSRVGAIGLMQLMPQTALGLRITDPWNPEHNIQGGIKYIAQMLRRFDGKAKLAIAAYNAGPGNVRKYKGIPPFRETRNYVKKVYAEYQRLKADGISYPEKIQVALK